MPRAPMNLPDLRGKICSDQRPAELQAPGQYQAMWHLFNAKSHVAGSAVTSDARYLSADKPEGEFKVILPRKTDVDYDVYHRQDHIFITIRDEQRPNSELLVAPLSDPTQTQVTPLPTAFHEVFAINREI